MSQTIQPENLVRSVQNSPSLQTSQPPLVAASRRCATSDKYVPSNQIPPPTTITSLEKRPSPYLYTPSLNPSLRSALSNVNGPHDVLVREITDELLESRIHTLAFQARLSHETKQNLMDPSLVLKSRRPFPGRFTTIIKDQEVTFDDISLRIDFHSSLPTISFISLVNPQGHAQYHRKFILDLHRCQLNITPSIDKNSFSFEIEDGCPLRINCPDPSPYVQPSDFELFMRTLGAVTSFSGTWHGQHDYKGNYALRWGLKYWIDELYLCRQQYVRRIRKYCTDWGRLLEAEHSERCSRKHDFTVTASISNNEFNSNYRNISFPCPEGFRGSSGSILAVRPLDISLPSHASVSAIPVQLPPDMPGSWLSIQLHTDDVSGVIHCVLVGVPSSLHLSGSHAVAVRLLISETDYARAILIRNHVVLKLVGPDQAKLDSEGVKYAYRAVIPHNINLHYLAFTDLQQPPRNITIEGYHVKDFCARSRHLNKEQLEAVSHIGTSSNRVTIVDGPPGTGKSLFLTMVVLHAVTVMKFRCLVTAYNNASLDTLTLNILSVFDKELSAPSKVKIVRLHAPSLLLIQQLSEAFGQPLEIVSKRLAQSSLPYQRILLATRLSQSGSKVADTATRFIDLNRELFQHGQFIGQRPLEDQLFYKRFTSYLNARIIAEADILLSTCYMASDVAIMETSSFDVVVIDESSAARDEQLFSSFIFQEKLKALIMVGDPKQSKPFISSKQAESLQDNIHRRMSALPEGMAPSLIQFVEQHRQEENLITFINWHVYNNRLRTSDYVLSGRPDWIKYKTMFAQRPLSIFDGKPESTTFIDNDHLIDVENGVGRLNFAHSTLNQAEAIVAIEIVSKLLSYPGISPSSILVNCTYIAQRTLILRKLATLSPPITTVRVLTVDAAIGQECDFSIVLTSRTKENIGPGFVTEDERFNVAMTRARFYRFVLVDRMFFLTKASQSLLGRFCSYMEACNLVSGVVAPDIDRFNESISDDKDLLDTTLEPTPTFGNFQIPKDLYTNTTAAFSFFLENDFNL